MLLRTAVTVSTVAMLGDTALAAAMKDGSTKIMQARGEPGLGAILAPFLGKIFGYAVFGDGPDPCFGWAHTNEAGNSFTWSNSSDDTVWAAGCWTTDTSVDNGNYDLHTLTQQDIDVANCLTNLHFVQQDTCISVAGSSCDFNGYSANGGVIINSRLGASSSSVGISAAQSSAAQGVLNALVGTQMIQASDMPQITWYDSDQGNYEGSPYDAYQLNMASGGVTTC